MNEVSNRTDRPEIQSQSDSDETPQEFSRTNPNPVLKDRFFFDFLSVEPTIKWNRNQMEIDKVYLVETFIDWLNGEFGDSPTFTIHRESHLDQPHTVWNEETREDVDQGYTIRGHHYGSNYDHVDQSFHKEEFLERTDQDNLRNRMWSPGYLNLRDLLKDYLNTEDQNNG